MSRAPKRLSGRKALSLECEAGVGTDGRLDLPHEVAAKLTAMAIRRVRVGLTSLEFGRELESRGISEEEISRIASRQHETREQVLTFLLSEGCLPAGPGGKARR